MNSIRTRLTVILLGTLGILFLASGAGFHIYARHVLLSSFDEGLLSKAQFLASTTEQLENGGLGIEFKEPIVSAYGRRQAVDYFQVWGENGQTLLRSPFLGTRDLLHVPADNDVPQFRDIRLPDGHEGRAVTMSYTPQGGDDDPQATNYERRPVTLAFASPREELDRTLRYILKGLVAVGTVLILCVIPAVWWAVRKGLHPLRHISEQTRMIGAEDLSIRLSSESMPQELVPVCLCLNDLMQRLEGAFVRERRFTADAAHELRTPIAELRTLAEVGLAESQTGCPEMTGYFEDALAVARHLENLVTALLALARCEAGTQKTHMRTVDLAELTRETWVLLCARTRGPSHETQMDIPQNALVTGDPDLLKNMLANLMSNAITYTPAGGRIEIALRREDTSWLVRIANATSQLQRDDLNHIFDPFWRKQADRSDPDHCGLGLTMVAAYARLMKIPVRTEISPDQVFVISFEFPAFE